MSRHFLTFILFMLALLCENAIAQTEQTSLSGQWALRENQVNGTFEIRPFSAKAPGLEQAIQRPPEPRHVVDSRFLFVNGAYELAAAYDGATTQWFLHNTGAYEVKPLFGRHPSNTRLWGEGSALTAAVIFGSYGLKSIIRDSGGCRRPWALPRMPSPEAATVGCVDVFREGVREQL